MKQKTLAVFGGYTSHAEAQAYAARLPEQTVLIKVLSGPTGMPVTPMAYFPLTRSLIKEMYKELKRIPSEDEDE